MLNDFSTVAMVTCDKHNWSSDLIFVWDCVLGFSLFFELELKIKSSLHADGTSGEVSYSTKHLWNFTAKQLK